MNLSWKSTTVSLMLLSCALTGCPNPNIYGTPRTTPKGEISQTFAVEALSVPGRNSDGTSTGTRVTLPTLEPLSAPGLKAKETNPGGTIPTLPTYQLRYGATENADLGFSVRNFTSLGVDFKYNPIKGEVFDLAIDPGAQISVLFDNVTGGIAYLHLLLGLNFGKSLSLVLSPGTIFAVNSDSDKDSTLGATGLMGRLGAGLNIRISESFALQPEVNAMRPITSVNRKFTIMMIGLGFNFGKLPTF